MGETIDKVLADTETEIDQAALRAAVAEAIAEDGGSASSFGKNAGLNVGTFLAWRAGTYAGNNQKIAAKVKIYLASRAARATTQAALPARTSFVMTPSARAFMSLFRQAQFGPEMATLVGVPGVGKTMSAREYQRETSNVFLVTAAPMMRGPYALLSEISTVMGVREGSPLRQTRAIANMLRGRAALLIIDEAQHISLQALDQVRTLHDDQDVQLGIALLGNHDVKARMAGGGKNGAFAQLDSRFGVHINRRGAAPGDVLALLQAEGIDGDEEQKLLRGVAARPGALRKMIRILRLARQIAAGQDEDQVTVEHIQAAIQQMSDVEAGA